jgi:PAS domain S-box-containing protein
VDPPNGLHGQGVLSLRWHTGCGATEEALCWNSARGELLSEMAARLLQTTDPQGVVEELCLKAMRFLDCDVFINYLSDERSGRLRLNASAGIPEHAASALEWLDLDGTVCGCVASHGRRMVAECVAASEAAETALVRSFGINAYCCHPLLAAGRVIGTLSFGARKRQSFAPAEIGVMEAVASLVSMAMNRIHAEKAIRTAEARFRGIYEHALGGMAIVDWEGCFLQCNPTFSAITGYSEGELQGRHFSSIIHPDDRARDAENGRRLRAGEAPSIEMEVRYVKRNGQPVWVRKIISLLPDETGEASRVVVLAIDMTKRKQAEEAQQASEARLARDAAALRRLNDASSRLWGARDLREGLDEMLGACIELLGADKGNVLIFDPVRRMLKIEAHRGVEKHFLDLFGEVSVEIETASGLAMRLGKRVIVEDVQTDERVAPFRAAAAESGFRAVQATPLIGRDGALLGTLSTFFRDVHRPSEQDLQRLDLYARQAADFIERCRADEKLRESERRYRLLHENMRDAFVQVAMDGRIVEWNDHYCQLTGYSPGEIGALTYQELTPARWHEYEESIVRDQIVARGYSDVYEKEYRRKDGTIVPIELRTVLSRDGQGRPIAMWGIIRDISGRKQAEEALKESERRFRGVFENAGTGIAITDLQGRFQSCNPAYTAMLGYSEAELRAMNFADLVHPEDREANMAKTGPLIAEELSSFEIFNRYIGKDGAVLWVHKHVSLLYDAAGGPAGMVALVTDLTERKRHENQINLLLREVNHRAKNMLALVQAMARQTAANDPQNFVERFGERVRALAASQDLLVKAEWKGVDLGELICSQLAHFKDLIGRRIELRGPQLFISAPAAQTIGMALHELATNAGKYGALSAGEGRIAVDWALDGGEGDDARFALSWREEGGPPVAAPTQSGFGSTVIGPMAKMSLDADVELSYAPEGLLWRLECPAANVLERAAR